MKEKFIIIAVSGSLMKPLFDSRAGEVVLLDTKEDADRLLRHQTDIIGYVQPVFVN